MRRIVTLVLFSSLILVSPVLGAVNDPADEAFEPPRFEFLSNDERGVNFTFELSDLPVGEVEADGQRFQFVSIPGGGFAGGVIIALSFVHLTLAYGKDTALRRMSKPRMSILESTGAIMFLTIALSGLASGYFFSNFFD